MKLDCIVWKVGTVVMFLIGCLLGVVASTEKLWDELGWLRGLTTHQAVFFDFAFATALWAAPIGVVLSGVVLASLFWRGLSASASK